MLTEFSSAGIQQETLFVGGVPKQTMVKKPVRPTTIGADNGAGGGPNRVISETN
jgi:hypothetical protein